MSEAPVADTAAPAPRALQSPTGISLSTSTGVLALQRAAGNRAVARLVAQRGPRALARDTWTDAPPETADFREGVDVPDIEEINGGTAAAGTAANEINGEIGEHLLSQALDQRGLYVFTDWGKHVSATGIDRVAYDPVTREAWVLDNKAQLKGIADASALTGERFGEYLEEVKTFLRNNGASKEAQAALAAIEAKRYRKVVANAYSSETARFTESAFSRGLSVFDIRMMRLFTSHAEWRQAFSALVRLPRMQRIAGIRGAGLLEGSMLIFAVAGTACYLAQAGTDTKTMLKGMAAEAGLGALLMKLPGGLFGTFVLDMESDESPAQREARQRNEQIDYIIWNLPSFKSMSEEDIKITRGVIKSMLEQPLVLPAKPEPPKPKPSLPGFKWPDQPSTTEA